MKSRKGLIEGKLNDYPFLIMTHRGLAGGNIIQNTRQAVEIAVQVGSDIVEVDILRSKDGVYYLFHTKMEATLLAIENSIADLTSSEIDNFQLLNHSGWKSGVKVEKLEDFLNWLPEDYLINLDKSWDYWSDETFWNLIYSSGKVDQLIFKSFTDDEYLDILKKLEKPVNYFPIVTKKEDWQKILTVNLDHIVGVELLFQSVDQDIVSTDFMANFKDYPLVLVNAEDLGEGYNMAAELTDTGAILGNFKDWHKLIQLGFTAIQTDFPYLLIEYRNKLQ